MTAVFRFFGGKGGVGKTTLAAAEALRLAAAGADVLIVSTDPAHSLGDALGAKLGGDPRLVRGVKGKGRLRAVELDAARAARRWIDEHAAAIRVVAERGTYLDATDVDSLLRLSLPGVDELFGLLEVLRVSAGAATHVVVDTAPSGHTLKLLAMPETLGRIAALLDAMEDKHRYLALTFGRGIRAGDPGEALVREITAQATELTALLHDSTRASFTWVLLPERMALEETRDGLRALETAGIRVDTLVVNRVTPEPLSPCAFCSGRRTHEQKILDEVRRHHRAIPLQVIPALDSEPRGLSALCALGRTAPNPSPHTLIARRDQGVRHLDHSYPQREVIKVSDTSITSVKLFLFGGKGGVGKTTAAAAHALQLARVRPGERILLLSTDPAHSLADVLGVELGDRAREVTRGSRGGGVWAREQDAATSFARRREELREAAESLFAAVGRTGGVEATHDARVVRDLLELSPPGLDEMLAVLATMDALVPARSRSGRARRANTWDRVVIDTAPTGHALRLLEMPQIGLAWVRALMRIVLEYRAATGLGELARDLLALSQRIQRFRLLLSDPAQTAFVAVTRAAELPRLETERLVRALGRLDVPLAAVLVNALTPADGCARCRRAAAAEAREVRALRSRAARGVLILQAPAVAPPPRGAAALESWADTWTHAPPTAGVRKQRRRRRVAR